MDRCTLQITGKLDVTEGLGETAVFVCVFVCLLCCGTPKLGLTMELGLESFCEVEELRADMMVYLV